MRQCRRLKAASSGGEGEARRLVKKDCSGLTTRRNKRSKRMGITEAKRRAVGLFCLLVSGEGSRLAQPPQAEQLAVLSYICSERRWSRMPFDWIDALKASCSVLRRDWVQPGTSLSNIIQYAPPIKNYNKLFSHPCRP